MQALHVALNPLLKHPMFIGFLKNASAAGITVEMLLGIALGFVVMLVYLLHTMMSVADTVALSATEFRSFQLIAVEQISPDTKKLKFALQSSQHVLGLPVGQHITLRCKNKTTGEDVQRSYTPISSNDDKGYVEFVIKIYFPNVHPRFPNGGAMTMHLENLKVGDRVDMRGPKGTLDYEGKGAFSINQLDMSTGKRVKKTHQKKRFGFVAGGSGITPCLQVINAMLKSPSDESEIWLLYANQTEKDILLREQLEKIAEKYPRRFHLHFTLDKAPKRGWKGSEGFIDTAMCKLALPAPEKRSDGADTDAFIFICGPPPMIKFAVEPALREIGFKDGEWMVF